MKAGDAVGRERENEKEWGGWGRKIRWREGEGEQAGVWLSLTLSSS
jgi:hypothetical protein